MNKTSIEWTDFTWNPIRARNTRANRTGTFCTRISPGCKNCYASVINRRFGTGLEYEVPELKLHEFYLDRKILGEPLERKKPARIFVGDMFDLFHESIADEMLDAVFAVIALAREHTFQVLTKRATRMQRYMSAIADRAVPVSLAITRNAWWDGPHGSPCATATIEDRLEAGPLPHLWLGVSVEDQQRHDERAPTLQDTPAAVRFLSVEPQLEEIRLAIDTPEVGEISTLRGFDGCEPDIPGIDWVICGGESGPGARPFHLKWASSLLRQCQAARVPFFMKQIGSNPIGLSSVPMCDRKGGDPAEWPDALRVREFPSQKAEVVPA